MAVETKLFDLAEVLIDWDRIAAIGDVAPARAIAVGLGAS